MNNYWKKQGMVLVLVVVVMTAMLLLVTYFLNFIITENKIAQSHALATQTYYLAEAGVQEAIWKIKHDPLWLENFQTNPTWQATIERQNVFNSNQSYQVLVQNNDLGNARVLVSGWIAIGEKQSQRVVKTIAFQPEGQPTPEIEPYGIIADDDANFTGSVLEVSGGGIFAGDDINLSFFSDINLTGKASAVDRISIPWGSSLSASLLESANYPPAPASQEMPQIDFNSEEPNSYINQADYIYSTSQFNQLFQSNPDVNLTGIIYVTGNATIPRGYTLTINGALVAEGNIKIGTEWWPSWKVAPSLIIRDPGSGQVGLLSMRKIIFQSQANSIEVTGLIYAADEFKLDWLSPAVDLTGGIIVRKLTVSNFFNPITVIYDANLVARALGTFFDAPIINIEHWEEEY